MSFLIVFLVVILTLVSIGIVLTINELSGLGGLFTATRSSEIPSPLRVVFRLHVQQAPDEIYQLELSGVRLINRASDPQFCVERRWYTG